MTGHYLTRNLETHDMTISSHLSSLTIRGQKISQLQGEKQDSTSVHLNFAVKERHKEPCVLAGAEELELILDSEDAYELGLLLVAMGMKKRQTSELSAIEVRMYNLIAELNQISEK
jgi:hypothetical protein